MAVKVRYFAALRDRLGRAGDELEVAGATTVREVWERTNEGQPPPDSLLVAINFEYSRWEDAVRDGDEVAFFPPVTGG